MLYGAAWKTRDWASVTKEIQLNLGSFIKIKIITHYAEHNGTNLIHHQELGLKIINLA